MELNEVRTYLLRKLRTIRTKEINLSNKQISDFEDREQYEKWYRRQSKTISSMIVVANNMLRGLRNGN